MRHATPALATVSLLALALFAGAAQARSFEETVYLHDVSGLHLTPAVIYAKVGDTLTILVENEGEAEHNLRVCGDPSSPIASCEDIWGFTPAIPPGGTDRVIVQVKEAGTFDYYCAIPGHKGSAPGALGGMWGQLVVQGDEKPAPAAPVVLMLGALAILALLWRRRA